MIHSLYHYAYLNDLLSDVADQWLAGTIKRSEVEKLVSPPAFSHRYFTGLLQFLSDLFDSGFQKAYKKNEDFIQPILGKSKQNSLFGTQKKADAPHKDEERTNRILTVYEKWQDERLGKRKVK